MKEITTKLTQQVNFWEAKVKEKKRTVDAQNAKLNEVKLNIRSRNDKYDLLNKELSQLQENVIKKMNQLNQVLAFSQFGPNPFSTQHLDALEQEYKQIKNEIAQLTIPDWNKKKMSLKNEYQAQRKMLEKEYDSVKHEIEELEVDETKLSEDYNNRLQICQDLYHSLQLIKCQSCGENLTENDEVSNDLQEQGGFEQDFQQIDIQLPLTPPLLQELQ